MVDNFFSKLITSLQAFVNNPTVESVDGGVKITCECTYCGRSNRGLPHLGIIVLFEDEKTTGGINCFRCGTHKSLKEYLFDIKEVLENFSISENDIKENVVVKKRDDLEKISCNFTNLGREFELEQQKLYYTLKQKYYNKKFELKKMLFLNMNAFVFIKNRLKLTHSNTIYQAFKLLNQVKCKPFFYNNKIYLLFGKKNMYVFNPLLKIPMPFDSDEDKFLYGDTKFRYVLGEEYVKIKRKNIAERYYIITDKNYTDEVNTVDYLNVYLCEGTFDALSVKYYKNLLDLDNINDIDKNIYNLYVAMGHSKIDKMVFEYLNYLQQVGMPIVGSKTTINFVLVPDLNKNIRTYLHRLYNEFKLKYNEMKKDLTGTSVKVYYMDVYTNFSGKGLKDINDIISKCAKKSLCNIKIIEIF